MLYSKLSDCIYCNDITTLINNIDCKIVEVSKSLYNNTIYMLNKNIDLNNVNKILIYKRILLYKQCNSDYAGNYTIEMIANKIKLLIHK